MKTISIIIKDISFSFIWLCMGIAITLASPIYAINSNLHLLLQAPFAFFCAVIGANLFLSRACYIDDEYETKIFNKALPVHDYERVASKYIMNFLIQFLLIGFSIAMCTLIGINYSFILVFAFISLNLIYDAIYLFIFHFIGINAAQYTLVAIGGLGMVIYLLYIKNSNLRIDIPLDDFWFIIALIISCLIYIISALLSCKFIIK